MSSLLHESYPTLQQLGVAMGNAGEKVKSLADAVVATNDEDGVAEAISRFVLEK